MKYVAIDANGVIFSKNNAIRPFFVYVLRYCIENKIRLIILPNGKDVERLLDKYYPDLHGKFFGYEIPGDVYPNLLITTDSTIKAHPTLIVPFYDETIHNDYSELVMAGKVLEALRNRVILNKNEVKIEPKKEDKPNPPPYDGDITKYGSIIIR